VDVLLCIAAAWFTGFLPFFNAPAVVAGHTSNLLQPAALKIVIGAGMALWVWQAALFMLILVVACISCGWLVLPTMAAIVLTLPVLCFAELWSGVRIRFPSGPTFSILVFISLVVNIGNWIFWAEFLQRSGPLFCTATIAEQTALLVLLPLGRYVWTIWDPVLLTLISHMLYSCLSILYAPFVRR
jgi:hypothetical protein